MREKSQQPGQWSSADCCIIKSILFSSSYFRKLLLPDDCKVDLYEMGLYLDAKLLFQKCVCCSVPELCG